MIYFIAFFILIITLIVIWFKNLHNYWKKRHVETESMSDFYTTRSRKHIAFTFQRIYNKLKRENKTYAGIYNLITPGLVVTDLETIKTIHISDFEIFPDRGMYSNPHNDPLSLNLLRLSGDLWKKIRNKITPTLTSGKMKMMFPTVAAIGEKFIEVMRENVEIQNSEVEIRDLCARFTTDVIGSVAFGLECNSLREPHTEFRVKGDKAFYTMHPIMDILASAHPKFFQKIGYKVFTKELIDFYSQIVRKNVEYREKHNIKRNDFLDILIDLKNNKQDANDFYLRMEDVIAQAFVFFIGGFETSSSTMSFALYELAFNPKVQEKARENIRETLEKHNGEFNYESLNEMFYIKQVVQETLRKHPVAPTARRVCRRTYTLAESKPITIDPGVQIIIPVYAIHHDPILYPEPDMFRPERFSLGEKEHRHPMAYLPFGAGPRTCIAERFGIMQVMIGLALLLNNFTFSVSDKTPTKLNFDPFNTRVFHVKDGIYLNVENC